MTSGRSARAFSWCFIGFGLFIWLFSTLNQTILVLAETSAAAEPRRTAHIDLLSYSGIINPVAAEYFEDGIAAAEAAGRDAILIELDTPGGLDTSMRLIIKAMNASSIPVIVYVAPSGSRAASAGTFIMIAAHVAAMAPGTNIGSAHPVAMGGGEMDEVMKAKVENDAAAYIKSMAEKRGRNAEWAEAAVRESVNITGTEAVELNVIDVVAEDIDALLEAIDGRTVKVGAETVTLATKGATLHRAPLSWRLRLLNTLIDPNVAYILMLLGTYGLIYELMSPGAIFPGVVGAICIVLALYAFQTLPINYAGLLLIILAIVLFIAEVKVPSFGLLTIGGIVAMFLGSLMLMKTDLPYMRVSLSVIVPSVLGTALFFVFVVGMAVRTFGNRPETGLESMIGQRAVVRSALAPVGSVFIHGELWEAKSDETVDLGDEVEITGAEGLRLLVKRPASTSPRKE